MKLTNTLFKTISFFLLFATQIGCGGGGASDETQYRYTVRAGSIEIQSDNSKSATPRGLIYLSSVNDSVEYTANSAKKTIASGVLPAVDFFGWWEHPNDPLSQSDRRYQAQVSTIAPDGTPIVQTVLIHSPTYDPNDPSLLTFAYETAETNTSGFVDLATFDELERSKSGNHSLQIIDNYGGNPALSGQKPITKDHPLDFIYTSKFNLIWSDRDSGSTDNVSVWMPVPPSDDYSNYVPLGGYAKSGYDRPSSELRAILVNVKSENVKVPSSYKILWNSSGSGAKKANAVSFNAGDGFQCLGDTVYRGNLETLGKTFENIDHDNVALFYACLSESLTEAAYIPIQIRRTPHLNNAYIWDDNNSGGHHDGSFWKRKGDDEQGYDLFFSAFNSHLPDAKREIFTLKQSDLN